MYVNTRNIRKSYLNILSVNNFIDSKYRGVPLKIYKDKISMVVGRKCFFTSNSNSDSESSLPIAVLILTNLDNKDCIKSYKKLLKNKGGIYSFFNTVYGNQYIGSAKDFDLRLNEHLKNQKSNIVLPFGPGPCVQGPLDLGPKDKKHLVNMV